LRAACSSASSSSKISSFERLRGAAARASLIYTQPGEAFNLYITVSLIAGVVLAAPFIMYQIWMFIAPGLYSNEKRWAFPSSR
jgi:sec-independent protein translocase protein TatC